MTDEMIPLRRLLTDHRDIGQTRVDETQMEPLREGEALLALETFAVTTNNLTYAAFGHSMRYWDFFPTGVAGWGQMPVWGFATVRASRSAEVPVGERYFGYFPMANVLRVLPGRFSHAGFYDVAEHRRTLPSPYQHYVRCSRDPAYLPELADLQMLLRPLFFTSYMLADFLGDQEYFGAEQLFLSSASSKTAYGTAFCLRQHPRRPILVGLTSERNRGYVEKLGLYDRVVSYGNLDERLGQRPSVYVDFSGDDTTRRQVHDLCGKNLRHDCYAGSTTNPELIAEDAPFDPPPKQFFAPVQIKKRNQDWGRDGLLQRYTATEREFLAAASEPSRGWLQIARGKGLKDAASIVRTLKNTGGRPEHGHVIDL